MDTAEQFWRAINPSGRSAVHVLIPPASILILPKQGHKMLPADIRKLSLPTSRVLLPRLKPLFYAFRVIVLPQAMTAAALYFLLLYLLKDADLLDAQRNRLGRGEVRSKEEEDESSTSKPRSVKGVQAHILPCSHQADIDLAASNADGRVIVSGGVDNTLCLWRLSDAAGTGTREQLKAEGIEKSPAVALDVSPDGRAVAALLATGVLQIWDVPLDGQPKARPPVELGEVRATALRIVPRRIHSDDPFVAMPVSPGGSPLFDVLVALADGSVLSVSNETVTDIIRPGDEKARVFFLDHVACTQTAILVTSPYATTLYQASDNGWEGVSMPVSCGDNPITAATIGSGLIVLGSRSGVVEVFDLSGALVVAIGSGVTPTTSGTDKDATSPSRATKRVAIASPPSSRCTTCGSSTTDCTFIISSTSDQIHVDRLNTSSFLGCRCARRPSGHVDDGQLSPERLAVPPSMSRGWWSPILTPKKSPSLVPPLSNGEFPLSSHGSRRLSGANTVTSTNTSASTTSTLNGSHTGTTTATTPNGFGLTPLPQTEEVELLPLGAIFAPGGGETWSVHLDGSMIIGIKRVGGGIDDAQWVTWSVDLQAPWNGTNLVVDSLPLTSLLRPSIQPSEVKNEAKDKNQGGSVKAQRDQRIFSLSGRTAFPSTASSHSFSGSGSFSMKTFPPLAYVEIRPFISVPISTGRGGVANGGRSVSGGNVNGSAATGVEKGGHLVLGLGNRLAILTIPQCVEEIKQQPFSAGFLGSSLGMVTAGGGGGTGISFTPPPPLARRNTAEKKSM